MTITSSGYSTYTVSDSVYYSGSTQVLTYRPTAIITPTPTPEPEHANVRFTIRDSSSGDIIPNYHMTIRDDQNAVLETGTITGEDNHFYYFSPIPSAYSIEITKDGYATYTETFPIAPVDGLFKTIYLSPHALTFNMDVKSATTGYLIQGAHIGIYDPVHAVWRNSTAPTGMVYYDSTGENYEYPLFVGENVTVAAWADDYFEISQDISIPYDQYLVTLNLPPLSAAPISGTYTVVFTVVSNVDQQPIPDVTITSGLGAIKLTNSGGSATFTSVPIGSSRYFDLSAAGYQGTSVYVNGVDGQVIMKSVELVPVGATPTPTPIVTSNLTAKTGDLNVKGQTFVTNWADMAISFGGLFFLMGLVWFSRKVMK